MNKITKILTSDSSDNEKESAIIELLLAYTRVNSERVRIELLMTKSSMVDSKSALIKFLTENETQ